MSLWILLRFPFRLWILNVSSQGKYSDTASLLWLKLCVFRICWEVKDKPQLRHLILSKVVISLSYFLQLFFLWTNWDDLFSLWLLSCVFRLPKTEKRCFTCGTGIWPDVVFFELCCSLKYLFTCFADVIYDWHLTRNWGCKMHTQNVLI